MQKRTGGNACKKTQDIQKKLGNKIKTEKHKTNKERHK